MPSPVYCSTRPPWACTASVKRSSAPSITAWMVSGSRLWPIAVEPTTSTNSTETCLSRCTSGGGERSAASSRRSGASAVSTTASPSSARCAASAAIAAAICSAVLLIRFGNDVCARGYPESAGRAPGCIPAPLVTYSVGARRGIDESWPALQPAQQRRRVVGVRAGDQALTCKTQCRGRRASIRRCAPRHGIEPGRRRALRRRRASGTRVAKLLHRPS